MKLNTSVLGRIAFAILLFAPYLLAAQVSIGTNQVPEQGALLELSEGTTTTKGLGLPRVKLTHGDQLYPMLAPGYNAAENEKHVGLMVYAVQEFDIPVNCPGIYVWDGAKWSSISPSVEVEAQQTFTDGEGNTYTYKKYGNLKWMTQNARSIYQNGDPTKPTITTISGYYVKMNHPQAGEILVTSSIPSGSNAIISQRLNDPAAPTRQLNLTREEFATRFGLQYNPYQGGYVCPTGWRLPSSAEWRQLAIDLGGTPEAGNENNAVVNGGLMMASDNFMYTPGHSTKQWVGLSMCSPLRTGFNAYPSGSVGYFGEGTVWLTATSGMNDAHINVWYQNSTLQLSNSWSHLDVTYRAIRCVQD